MSESETPRGLEVLPESGATFSGVQEAIVERQPGSMPPRLFAALGLVVALAAAAAVVAWVRGGDDAADATADEAAAEQESADENGAEPGTDEDDADSPDETEVTEPAAPPRSTLPPPTATDTPIGDLPPVRPEAELVGTITGDPASDVPAMLYRLDLLTGETRYVPLPGPAHTLVDLGAEVGVGVGRDILRVNDSSGDTVVIANGVNEVMASYGPPGIVAVVRSSDHLLARVVGPDGVFRSAVQLPNEAVVHGAMGDHVVVSLAGRVMAVDGRNAALQLGAGRVLAVGNGHVVRLQCEDYGCRIADTGFSTSVGAERREDWCEDICDESSDSFDGDRSGLVRSCELVCDLYPIVTGPISERIVSVPAELAAASPDRWSELGVLSPDASRMAIRLRHGNGAPAGVVVVDLDQDWGRHSPEIGIDLGHMAWSPDSRFLLYTLDDDVMVWDLEAVEGQLPSGRAQINEPLERILLRPR